MKEIRPRVLELVVLLLYLSWPTIAGALAERNGVQARGVAIFSGEGRCGL